MLKGSRDAAGVVAEEPVQEPAEGGALPRGGVVKGGYAGPRTCSAPGCASRTLARGYCIKHYYQVKRHGAVQADGIRATRFPAGPAPCTDGSAGRREPAPPRARPPAWLRLEARCREDACGESPFARGLCRLHYIMVRAQDLDVESP